MAERVQRTSIWKHDIQNLTQKAHTLSEIRSNPWYILSPETSLINSWNKFMTMILVYTAIVTPFTVSFMENETIGWTISEYVVSFMFFIDFLLTCFEAYYDDERNLVFDLRKILSNYATGWMIPDVVACLPINLLLSQDKHYNSLIRVARLPRLYRLFKMTKLLRLTKVMRGSSPTMRYIAYLLKISITFERIFWFILIYILLVHIVTCMWVFVGFYDSTSANWITVGGYEDTDNMTLYIISLYWTVTTFTTVGYGDIVAINTSEKLFTVTVMTLGIIFYSYTISSITSVLSNIDSRKAKLKSNMMTLDRIAKDYQINSTFYIQISTALEFTSNQLNYGVHEFISDLPGSLGNQVLIVTYEKALASNAFFEKKSTEFVGWLATRLRFCKFYNGEIIYLEGEYASQMYFISKGSVNFVLVKDKAAFPYLEVESGYYFGETDLLFSDTQAYQQSTQAAADSEFLTLTKESFASMLSIYEDQAPEICERAEKRMKRDIQRKQEAEAQLKHQMKIDKKKTHPDNESHMKIKMIQIRDTEQGSSLKEPTKQNLFKRILDSKLRFKEINGKIIRGNVGELEREVYNLRDTLDRLQDAVAEKFPKFTRKLLNLSVDASSIESPGVSVLE